MFNIPGRFCGHTQFCSHQLFHVLCVVAMLLERHSLSLVADDRLRIGGCLNHA